MSGNHISICLYGTEDHRKKFLEMGVFCLGCRRYGGDGERLFSIIGNRRETDSLLILFFLSQFFLPSGCVRGHLPFVKKSLMIFAEI